MPIVVATFVVCLGLILGIYWMFAVRPENAAARALRRRLTPAAPEDRPARTDLTKKDAPLSALKVLDAVLARSGHLLDPLKRTLADSGLPMTMGVVLLACGFFGTVTFSAIAILTSSFWLSAVIALVAGSLPYSAVRWAAMRRLRKLEEQLPQAVDMIAVSLRAGHAFPTGLLMVAEELADPLGAEFRLLYDQQTYGKPLPDVLRQFADRVPLLDARIFVTAVLTQRETGGNLVEVLGNLAAVIRERFRIRRQVRALSAHGRITGWTLALLPPALAVLLSVIAPAHIRVLIDDPFGRQLTAGAVGLQVLGMLAIRRIVSVEF
jgi:tight adherence protein B